MQDDDIAVYLMLNEPAFDAGGRRYSVCYVNGTFCTLDPDGSSSDFPDIASLLDNWIVDGRPFRQTVHSLL